MRINAPRPATVALCALAAGAALAGFASRLPAATPAVLEVVMSGLDNPRGLDVAANGALYVAEAGRGGEWPCFPGGEGGGDVCAGRSGAVSRLYKGKQERVATGLPSVAEASGMFATGPHDVSVLGSGNPQVVVGLHNHPDSRHMEATDNPLHFLGHLGTVKGGGKVAFTDDVATHELGNPDGTDVNSNPYSVLAVPGAKVVVDAGGNSLLRVGANGQISTLATFPTRLVAAPPFPDMPEMMEMQPVPTSVAQGPDGALYVGEMTGLPFPKGGARVWRVVPGQQPTVYRDGFTNISDIAWGKDGSLYVLELTSNGILSNDMAGALIRVRPDGTRSTVASQGLVAPTGLAVGPDGALYVSNKGVLTGVGEVVRVRP